MTIEIHRPELEALIRERMKIGGFQNVEDVLMQALESSPPAAEKDAGFSDETPAAYKCRPCRSDAGLALQRNRLGTNTRSHAGA